MIRSTIPSLAVQYNKDSNVKIQHSQVNSLHLFFCKYKIHFFLVILQIIHLISFLTSETYVALFLSNEYSSFFNPIVRRKTTSSLPVYQEKVTLQARKFCIN